MTTAQRRTSGDLRRLLVGVFQAVCVVAYPLVNTQVQPHRAYRMIGLLYTEQGDYSRASRFAQETLRLHPLAADSAAGQRASTDPLRQEYLEASCLQMSRL